ncbi:MAG: hypothetical protein O2912_00885 [Proteobacteria bacterium]|nr:hypothetical protein [Pseudomonadota bacterium]
MTGPERIKVLDRNSGTARLTLLAHLDHAPYPVDNRIADFFNDPDPNPMPGERHRLVGYNRYAEAAHYQDNRILIHVPPGFDPTAPSRILLFLHGHYSELLDAVCHRHAVPAQLNRSGCNAILVAPQLAKNAADSHSGKLSIAGGARRLLDEVFDELADWLGIDAATATKNTPIIIAAFSGGYWAAADCLIGSELEDRIEGVLLFDALYGKLEEFENWRRNHTNAFFISLNGESTATNSDDLFRRLEVAGHRVEHTLPNKILTGMTVSLAVKTAHLEIPRAGPPEWPIAEILARLA